MGGILDIYFQDLGATIETVQINEDRLPAEFSDSVLKAANIKQEIDQVIQTRNAKTVEFQTNVIVAENQANVTIQAAVGESYKIQQNAKANAAIVELSVSAETASYKKIADELNLKGDSLIKYMWYDALSGGGVGSNSKDKADVKMLIGVNPSAYISQGK